MLLKNQGPLSRKSQKLRHCRCGATSTRWPHVALGDVSRADHGCRRDRGLGSGEAGASVPFGSMPADPPNDQADAEQGGWHRKSGGDFRIKGSAEVLRSFKHVAGETDHVIADCRNREAFDGLLQPQLQPRALVHRA